MDMMLIYVLFGLLSGFFAGLLGIGGGFITVPALYYLFLWKGLFPHHPMQIAISTSLASIAVTTAVSTFSHWKKRALDHPFLGYFTPGIVCGCILGALLASHLPSGVLRNVFGAMAIPIGLYFVFPKWPIPKIADEPNLLLPCFGLVIGSLSTLLGIGGGIYTIPLLLAYGFTGPKVAGTASLATFATSLTGTLAYLAIVEKSASVLGYIDIRSFIGICLGSLCTISIGIKLAGRLPAARIKRIFGCIMAATGLAMWIQ